MSHHTQESIIARDVSIDTYMEQYAADFCEWVGGQVIKMTPVHERHDEVTVYLRILLQTYLRIKSLGIVRSAPFTMHLESVREPDLQVILEGNPHYTPTGMLGPADICVEVVSPESVDRDYGTKLREYQNGGVSEYWIIDPIRDDVRFYRQNEDGIFMPQREDSQDNYRTPLLPDLHIHVPTLWVEPLPNPVTIVEAVQNMLGSSP